MGQQLGLSPATVDRIGEAYAPKSHRAESFKFSTDPQANDKVYHVVGNYLNPPNSAVVLKR